MSNTSRVFETSYQPREIHQQLLPIIYGTEAAGTHDDLFQTLHRETSRRDPKAPLYVTEADEKYIESREDITELRKSYAQASSKGGAASAQAQRVCAALNNKRKQIRALMVQEKRTKYFELVDRLRAEGKPTDQIHLSIPSGPGPKPGADDLAAAQIGRFLTHKHLGGTKRTDIYCGMIQAYLGHLAVHVEGILCSLEKSKTPAVSPKVGNQVQLRRWICLLCKVDFSEGFGLTRHNQNQHYRKGAFDRSFPCPACGPDFEVNGPEEWSNHTAR
ncbi:hypothetical protein QBC35DRAFT_551837, partial [Podospora australis]